MNGFIPFSDWCKRENVNNSTVSVYFRDGKIPGYCLLGKARTKNFVNENFNHTDIEGLKKRKLRKEEKLHPIVKEVLNLKLKDAHSTYMDILTELSEKYRDEYTIHDIAHIVKKNKELYKFLKEEHFKKWQ